MAKNKTPSLTIFSFVHEFDLISFHSSSFHSQGKLKDHRGDLARVVRSNPISEEISSAVGTNSNPNTSSSSSCDGDGNDKKETMISTTLEQQNNGRHPFVYDLELVMGGKLNGVPRFELKYTTASEEGMTGDSRKRRKRNPATTTTQEDIDSSSSKTDKKKKKITTSSNIKTKITTKKTATTTKNSNGKKRGLKNNVGNTSKKTKKQQDAVIQYAAATSETTTANSLGMFERHRREFERSVLRLQKIDLYNFFTDDYIPPEFDECYDSNINNNGDGDGVENDDDIEKSLPGEASTIPTSGTQQPQNTSMSTTTTLKNKLISSPSSSLNPVSTESSPEKYNDDAHEATATGDLSSSLSSSKENLKINDNDNKEATNSVTQFPSRPPYNFVVLRRRLEHGRYILDRERIEKEEYQKNNNAMKLDKMSNFIVQNPTGINWDLFREDVIGMCNSAVERDSDDDDDGSPTSTLCNTAGKIKVAVEQIYEKTGRRQIQEMESSNDAIRFTKAMDAAENTEAAMQGKKWKRDGKLRRPLMAITKYT